MHIASFIFAVLAAAMGFVAAARWYQASAIEVDPGWLNSLEPGNVKIDGKPRLPQPTDATMQQMVWTNATLQAMSKGAALNKNAAKWTAGGGVLWRSGVNHRSGVEVDLKPKRNQNQRYV